MTTIKLFSAVFATAALAFALSGASASADVLCKEEPKVVKGVEACAAPYPAATTVEASAKEALFASGEFKVSCASTLVWSAEKDLEPGKGVEGQAKTLLFTGCKGVCSSAKATALPYKAFASGSKEGDGALALSSAGKEAPGLTFTGCFGSLSCSYGAKELAFSIAGGNPAHISGKGLKAEKTSGGAFCPASGTLSADYEAQQPNAGALAIAQDVASISLSPFFPIIGLGARADITILNSGTVGWNITAISLTNEVDFTLLDPLPPNAECKGQIVIPGVSCTVGVKCETLNKNTSLKVEGAFGTFFDPVLCQ